MTQAIEAQAKATREGSVTLGWDLASLPSSQHRAGLLGLVLMVRWLGQKEVPADAICRLDEVASGSATLTLNQAGLKALMDEVYGARMTEVPSRTAWPGKAKLLREEISEEGGKSQRWFIYEAEQPLGAWMAQDDAGGADGPWVKLWRDMLWNVPRGRPTQRGPFVSRARGGAPSDVAKAWKALANPDKSTGLASTDFLGAQATTAEGLPFQDRSADQFLLQFWPYVVQIYLPQTVDNEGKRRSQGYALGMPDVADLSLMAEVFRKVARERMKDQTLAGYRPAGAMVTSPAEAGLKLLSHVSSGIEASLGAGLLRRVVLGIDVIHADKVGNNVDYPAVTRIHPDPHTIAQYRSLSAAYHDTRFWHRRLINLLEGRRWYDGMDRLIATTPWAHTIKSLFFRRDCRTAFEIERTTTEEEDVQTDAQDQEAKAPASLEALIYQIVGAYLGQRLKGKKGLIWSDVEGDEARKGQYREEREKIARDAFLGARSRSGDDFVEYFAGTMFSVPHALSREGYLILTQALAGDPARVRILTLLALSARS